MSGSIITAGCRPSSPSPGAGSPTCKLTLPRGSIVVFDKGYNDYAWLNQLDAAAVLGDARFAETVRAELQFWMSRGIHAVPAMVFQNRFLATGARGVAVYREILTRLREAPAAA